MSEASRRRRRREQPTEINAVQQPDHESQRAQDEMKPESRSVRQETAENKAQTERKPENPYGRYVREEATKNRIQDEVKRSVRKEAENRAQKKKPSRRSVRKGKGFKPIRFVTNLIILIAFLIVLTRMGLFPMFFELPVSKKSGQLQSDVGTNAIFFLTGNSYSHFVEQMDKQSIAPGTVSTLDLLNNTNTKGIGSFNTGADSFYIGLDRDVYRYRKKNASSNELKKIISDKPGNYERFPFTLEYRNIILQARSKAQIAIRMIGSPGSGNISFNDEYWWNYAELAKILYKNETEKITLREFLKIVLAACYDILYSWDSHIAVFRDADHIYTVNGETGETAEYTPLKDLNGTCYRLNSHSVLYLDQEVTKAYRLDFIKQEMTLIAEIPKSIETSVQFWTMDDGNLIIGGIKDSTKEPWVYIEKTGQLINYKASDIQSDISTALGPHSLMVFYDVRNDPKFRLCDFTEYLPN